MVLDETHNYGLSVRLWLCVMSVQLYCDHARNRLVQRGIKQSHVELCMRKGDRTNTDHGRFHYQYHGLKVVATSQSYAQATVVTAMWTSADGPDVYAKLLAEAKTRKLKKGQHRKNTRKQGSAYTDESEQFWNIVLEASTRHVLCEGDMLV
jgi:hypothetical protein